MPRAHAGVGGLSFTGRCFKIDSKLHTLQEVIKSSFAFLPRFPALSSPIPQWAFRRGALLILLGGLLSFHLTSAYQVGRASHENHALSLETLAKQLAATGAPSVAHELMLLAHQSNEPQVSALASFAVGYAAFQNRDFSSAVDVFANPDLQKMAFADYATLYLTRSQRQLKSYAAAIATLENFSDHFPNSNLSEDANQEICQAWIESGAANQCVKFLKEQPRFGTSPRLMLVAAQANEAVGQYEAEARLLERVAYGFPLSSEAGQAKDQLQDLRRHHPSSIPLPSVEMVHGRAEVYFNQKRYREALSDFQSALHSLRLLGPKASDEEVAKTNLRIGECLAQLGHLKEAATIFRNALGLTGDWEAEKLFAMAELKRKTSRGTAENFERAVQELEEKFPSSSWTEAAIFSLGNYFLVHQDRPQATAQFEKLLKEFPRGRNAPEVLFRVAWGAYLRRDYDEAQSYFNQFITLHPDSSRTVGALYWLGRIAELSNAPRAAAYYRAVVRDFGESIYAQSAAERVSKLRAGSQATLQGIGLPVFKAEISLKDQAPPDPRARVSLERADLFKRISLVDLAARELRAVLERGRSIEAAGELSRIYTSKQNYGAAMITVREVFPNYYRASLDEIPMEFWRALFPLAFWSTIQKEAERKSVDPFLVAALIRQESAFNAIAKSRASALGLMQLLPRQARRYARKERIRGWRLNKIFDPEINIQLGTAYLADALQRYHGNLEMTLAAYNAGDDRVMAWIQEQSLAGVAEDPMEFVESIPFTETREYVQILLRNLSYYKKIYSRANNYRE